MDVNIIKKNLQEQMLQIYCVYLDIEEYELEFKGRKSGKDEYEISLIKDGIKNTISYYRICSLPISDRIIINTETICALNDLFVFLIEYRDHPNMI